MSIRRLVESMGKALTSRGARLSRLALEPLMASLRVLLAYGVAHLRGDWRYQHVTFLHKGTMRILPFALIGS